MNFFFDVVKTDNFASDLSAKLEMLEKGMLNWYGLF